MIFDVQLSERLGLAGEKIDNVIFPMLGEHNVQNCLAAISVCVEMGIDPDIIKQGLNQFKGLADALILRARLMASPL